MEEGETSWRDVVDAFVESVDLHLMADVPLGLMLSEGVDSAAVAWAAAEAGRKLDCFTLDFLGSPGEGAGAARIAEAYGHSHHVLGADPDVESLVDDYLTHVDRPTCDGLNVLLVSNAIRAAGIKVALAGTGGDEVLAGYGHHRSRWVLGDKASRSARSSARAGLRFVSSGRGIGPFGLRQLGPRANEKLLAGLHGVARGSSALIPRSEWQHTVHSTRITRIWKSASPDPASKTWRLTSALASSQRPNGSTISGRCSWRMLMFSPWPRGWRRDSRLSTSG